GAWTHRTVRAPRVRALQPRAERREPRAHRARAAYRHALSAGRGHAARGDRGRSSERGRAGESRHVAMPGYPSRREPTHRGPGGFARGGGARNALRSDRLSGGAGGGGETRAPGGARCRAAAAAPRGHAGRSLHPAHGGAMIGRLLLTLLLLLGVVSQAQAVTWGWLGVRIRDLSEQE